MAARSAWIVVTLPVAFVACANILGIDDFTNAPDGAGGSGTGITTTTITTSSGAGPTTTSSTGGQGGSAQSACQWSRAFTSDREMSAAGVEVAPEGAIAIAGAFSGSADWGEGPVSSDPPELSDGYVLMLDVPGHPLWSKMVSAQDDQIIHSVAVDGASNVIVGGTFRTNDVFVDGVQLNNSGALDLFVLKLDSRGVPRWGMTAGQGELDQYVGGVGTDRYSNVYATGFFDATAASTVHLGSYGRESQGTDIYALSTGGDGTPRWDEDLSEYSDDSGEDIAADGAGGVVIVGWFENRLFPSVVSAGEQDVAVIKLDAATGDVDWHNEYGDAAEDRALAVATDGTDIIVAGLFRDNIGFEDVDAGPAFTSHGSTDAFVVRLDGEGDYLWSRSFGGLGADVAHDVAVMPEPSRIVAVAGVASGVVDFGDGRELTADEDGDVFVVLLDPHDGHTLWSAIYGGAGKQEAKGVAAAPDGSLVLHGNFVGSIDFGCGALTSTPNEIDDASPGQDVFVANLVPPL